MLSSVGAVEFISNNRGAADDADNVSLMLESLVRAVTTLVLAGEWSTVEQETKLRLNTALDKCLVARVGRKQSLECLMRMSAKPWEEERIKILLTGKTEVQQSVFSLVSDEGVDTVLLRAEMLVEAGLDKPGYKFISSVLTSLLADNIVFDSYITNSSPDSLLRLTDLFIALSTATHHLSRLYKILRLIGLETVNTVHLTRFINYSSISSHQSADVKEQVNLGRCGRLFTVPVCSKVIKIITQWSMAGAAIKECPPQLQQDIVDRYLSSVSSSPINTILSDVETLMTTATQTTFLYTLGMSLWRKVKFNNCIKV